MRHLLLCFLLLSCLQCANDTPVGTDSALSGKHIIYAEEEGYEMLPFERRSKREAYREKYPIHVDLGTDGSAVFTYSNGKQEKGKWRSDGKSFEIYEVKTSSKGGKSDDNQFVGKYTPKGELKGKSVFKNAKQMIYLQKVN